MILSPSTRRAWIEIRALYRDEAESGRSPSTRRAWIEIFNLRLLHGKSAEVALHPEGVDRNSAASAESKSPAPSPSTRRAWIEMEV